MSKQYKGKEGERQSVLVHLLPEIPDYIIEVLMTEKKEENRSPKKKPYQKPKVKSAKFYERKALACAKEVGGGNPDCSAGFYS